MILVKKSYSGDDSMILVKPGELKGKCMACEAEYIMHVAEYIAAVNNKKEHQDCFACGNISCVIFSINFLNES